ncbi:MAG: DUF3267 domain-containing protein [Chloroflexi bacterium]|nr:DUF3267 domain-containing protein [Chloroflexota bacterium]
MSFTDRVARLALLPGIALHELAHYYVCRAVGARIHAVCFFSFGAPAGYVVHTAPKTLRAHLAIVLGPLIVNTIAAVALFAATALAIGEMLREPPLLWAQHLPWIVVAGWLGLAAGLQALPSSGDAISLWQVARWHLSQGNLFAVAAYPIALLIRVTNWLRGVWVDWAYALVLVWVGVRISAGG